MLYNSVNRKMHLILFITCSNFKILFQNFVAPHKLQYMRKKITKTLSPVAIPINDHTRRNQPLVLTNKIHCIYVKTEKVTLPLYQNSQQHSFIESALVTLTWVLRQAPVTSPHLPDTCLSDPSHYQDPPVLRSSPDHFPCLSSLRSHDVWRTS